MLKPIAKTSTIDKVIENLIGYIQDDANHEGDKMPTEYTLCQELGVGRSTVREALRVLSTMGYVNIVHGKGAFILSKHPDSNAAEDWIAQNEASLKDIYVVRTELEVLMARLAAQKITKTESKKLQEYVDRTARLFEENGNDASIAKQLVTLDKKFHHYICACTRNNALISVYSNIEKMLDTYRLNSFSIVKNQRNVLEPHWRIAEAIIAHDEERAVEEMRQHMEISRHDMRLAADKK